ncbi:MAG TPA: MarR family transcriptional regulator [Pseudolabrys sp.]
MPTNAKTPDDLADLSASNDTLSFGYLARYAHRAFVRALADALEPHGLLTTQWSVLRVLWDIEGLTQVELAERMRVEKASLTDVLDGMERRGLIMRARNEKDRRKINITLTAQGRKLKAGLLPHALKINRKATRGMNDAEASELRRLLAKLIQNLES